MEEDRLKVLGSVKGKDVEVMVKGSMVENVSVKEMSERKGPQNWERHQK